MLLVRTRKKCAPHSSGYIYQQKNLAFCSYTIYNVLH
jgi:hypothetical protein